MLDLWLLLKDYIILIVWERIVCGLGNGDGGQMVEEGIPYAYLLHHRK